ncbi:MAG: hypothetical protein KDD63_26905 [Bacteroidetes bacterium]|nr:hypothetical protein [Bacteroidota bacterium]MCB0855892.1 hypothetical protein [Bacteroidota bacterium]
MLVFKPFIHITKVDDSDYRVSVVVSLRKGYKILNTNSNNINGNEIRLNVGHTANNRQHFLESFSFLLKGVKKNECIRVVVDTTLSDSEFSEKEKVGPDPDSFFSEEVITILGIAVGCTEGVEEDDDREGVTVNRTGESGDD